ncbi:Putative ribonuclease H protein At1g65750, partial [Linum perenne]
ETLISWILAPDDWNSINTDGSVIHPLSKSAASSVMRNSQDRFLGAFSANLGSSSIMRAKLRAAEIGLSYAWNMGAKKVILQLDSFVAVNSINGASADDMRHSHTLNDIIKIQQRDWQVTIEHVYREANRVADMLAHLGHSKPLGTIFFLIMFLLLSVVLSLAIVLGSPYPI